MCDRLNERHRLSGIFADRGDSDNFRAFLKIHLKLFGQPGKRLGLFADHLQVLHIFALKGGAQNKVVLDPGGLGSLVSEKLATPFGSVGIANHQPRRGHGDAQLCVSGVADGKQEPGANGSTCRQQNSQEARQQPTPA